MPWLELLITHEQSVWECRGWRQLWLQLLSFYSLKSWDKQETNKIASLDFQRANFSLFGNLLDRITWEAIRCPGTASWTSRTTFSKHRTGPFQVKKSKQRWCKAGMDEESTLDSLQIQNQWQHECATHLLHSGEWRGPWWTEEANVIPIFKKAKKEDPGNYRLRALTSVFWKIFPPGNYFWARELQEGD